MINKKDDNICQYANTQESVGAKFLKVTSNAKKEASKIVNLFLDLYTTSS